VKPETSRLTTLVFLLAALPLALAQDLQAPPSPATPPYILGPQLIAWSQLQKPQPIPQPLPPPDRPVQQADPQAPQPQYPPAQRQQPAEQTFTGTIVKSGTKYVLKVSGNGVYQLDDQDTAKQYDGKQVKVTGTLDAGDKVLHITRIELAS
jgi:hypothetical protein